jgi:hypothetical protein
MHQVSHAPRLKTRAASLTIDPPIARSIKGIVAHYGWTRTFIFQRLASGHLEAVKAGRRTLVTTESADRLYGTLPGARYRRPSGKPD